MMKAEQEVLTVEQALAEGYEFYGIEGHEFQTLQYITDLGPDDFDSDLRLFSKETVSPTVDRDSLIDKAVDDAHDSLDFRVDTSDIRDGIKAAVDWDSIVSKINEELSGHTFHLLTTIKLVP